MAFIDLRKERQERADYAAQQREAATNQAAEAINLLTSITQAPGYKVWRELVLANAQMEHQRAMRAATPHEMAMALGAESAYLAAAHVAEDNIARCQTTIETLKRST